MSVDREVVRHVAALARLRLTEDQEAVLTRQLADIVGYVDVLARSSGGDAPAPPGASAVRADEVVNGDRSAELLAAAPDRDGDRLRVPAVLGDPG